MANSTAVGEPGARCEARVAVVFGGALGEKGVWFGADRAMYSYHWMRLKGGNVIYSLGADSLR